MPDTLRTESLQLPLETGVEAVGTAFEIREGDCESESISFYDTWEWSLWFQHLMLFTTGKEVHLAEGEQGWPGRTELIADKQRPFPRFARDFADPGMRRALSKVTGLRAVNEVALLRISRREIDLLDVNRKIVCRLELTEVSTEEDEKPFYRLVSFLPLRGYDAEAARVRELLESGGATPVTKGPLAVLLERENRTPKPFTLKPVFDIHPDTRAREAVRRIVRRMLQIGESCEQGIVEDIDTEFLHDYRICIRKIRSVLSLVKGVYPPDRTESLKRTLSALGSATNRLRDLDVYLLSRDEYTRLLPEVFRPGLETMFQDFAAERKRELKAVRTHLASSDYRKRRAELDRFFTEPDALAASPTSHHAIGPLVAKRILKRYRLIRRFRKTLTPATPTGVVHELRIACKKLRYLLEFFAELFPADETAEIQKQLRRLQNRLGHYNDYAVQQTALMDYWEAKRRRGKREEHAALALSLGGLVAVLYQEQQLERERIHAALDAFCEKEVKELFQRVFKVDAADRPGPYAVR